MKKIEFIWRHILYETIEKRQTRFKQQDLAIHFSISSSTVSAALRPLRRLGAVHVGGRGFDVIDYEKILYHWANHRILQNDIVGQMHVNLPIREIESQLPDGTIATTYTAFRERFDEAPADYDKVYCYTNNQRSIENRFTHESTKGSPNLFILKSDRFLSTYPTIPLSHLFVDLWNLSDWYAKEFVRALKEHIDGLLS